MALTGGGQVKLVRDGSLGATSRVRRGSLGDSSWHAVEYSQSWLRGRRRRIGSAMVFTSSSCGTVMIIPIIMTPEKSLLSVVTADQFVSASLNTKDSETR